MILYNDNRITSWVHLNTHLQQCAPHTHTYTHTHTTHTRAYHMRACAFEVRFQIEKLMATKKMFELLA